MINNEENKIYEVRVIPFVKYVTKIVNGKPIEETVDTFSREERKMLSCEPSMLWERKDHVYLAEPPLIYNEGTGVKMTLYYRFDKLTEEEKKKYFDRSIVIKMTKPEEVIVYGEESKKFFGKCKKRKK